jgi:hypothetical protein
MTKTVKTYVELADMTGVHLECQRCHASLTIPFQRLDREITATCPSCSQDWGKRESGIGQSVEHTPQRYLRALGVALKEVLHATSTSNGVKINFEVSDLASSEKD